VVSVAKPEIGLSMLYCLDQPFSYALKQLTKLDIKHVELADEGLHKLNSRRVKKLNQVAKTHNLDYTVHAPWAGVNIATPNPKLRNAVLNELEKSIILAGQLNCRLWVFHPGSKTGLSQFYPNRDWQHNLESVQELLTVARKKSVQIAIENTPEPFPSLMKGTDDFHRFCHDLQDDVGMVLDVGHANINNQIDAFFEQFSGKIVHIHVSDNHADSDQHLGIGQGNINWQNFAKLVKKANYGKLIMIESTTGIQESLKILGSLF
jgi:sugar phosphate isomerase/epimerase